MRVLEPRSTVRSDTDLDKAGFLGRLNRLSAMCGSGHSLRVGEQPVFSPHCKELYTALPPGCCSIQPSVLQKTDQIWPLFPQAVQCPAQRQQNVHHRSGANHTMFSRFSGNTSADFYSIPDRTLLKHVGEAACYCFDSSAPFSWLSFLLLQYRVLLQKGVSGMAKRRANGEGKLRKRDGRWEGRYTTEHAPGTDKAIYRDVLGRIQEETKKWGSTL